MPLDEAEQARARMLAAFPDGFEELDGDRYLELAAYTDETGEKRLRREFGTVAASAVPSGWEDEWRRFHKPVQIRRLWVGPGWEHPPAGSLPVVIDPGRAFGTGGHPTTRLCLALLQEVPPASLLDVGCGSGVLAIAAARLGFAPVTAVDLDEAAVEATERNVAANGVEVRAAVVNALTDDLPTAEVTVANLTLELVEDLAARVPSGVYLASGYLAVDEPALPGWRRTMRLETEGWAADRFERS